MAKRKYYTHLRNIYIILIIIFTMVIAVSFYFLNMHLIDYKTKAAEKNATLQLVDALDSKLMLGTGIHNQLIAAQSIREFLKSPEINYRNLIAVMNELKSLSGSFSDSGLTVAVGKPGCEIVVTPECTKALSMLFKEDIGISEADGRAFVTSAGKKKFSNQDAISGSVSGKDNIITYVIFSDIVQLNQQLIYYLILDTDIILPKIDFEKNCIAVLYKDKVLYSHAHNDIDASTVLSNISGLSPVKNKFDYSRETVGNFTYHFMQSQRSDFMFYYITPLHQTSSEQTRIIFITVILSVILLSLGLFAAERLTKKSYSPVKQLLLNFENSDKPDHDEFSEIGNILYSLNNENNQLSTSIERTQSFLRMSLLRSLLQDISFSQQEYDYVFSNGELDWMKRDISVVECRLNVPSEHTSLSSSAITIDANISNNFYNIIYNALQKDMQCELVKINTTHTAIIFKADAEERLIQILSELLPHLEITFNIPATVAVSQITCDLKTIHVAFLTANEMLSSNITNVQHNILLRSEMPESNPTEFYYPIELEANLIDLTFNTMRNGVEKLIDQILTENFDQRSLTAEQLSRFKFALSVTVSRLLRQSKDKNTDNVFDETAIYSEIEHCQTRSDLKSTLLSIFKLIMDSIDSRKKTQSTSFATDLMEYISMNYQSDIALTDISRRFNLSASYLSTLFKNNFGENFKDYLNIYRIKKAKEIIGSNKYITVKELAAMVGFNNSDTFIRVFKRYEGVSPGQYISKNYKN